MEDTEQETIHVKDYMSDGSFSGHRRVGCTEISVNGDLGVSNGRTSLVRSGAGSELLKKDHSPSSFSRILSIHLFFPESIGHWFNWQTAHSADLLRLEARGFGPELVVSEELSTQFRPLQSVPAVPGPIKSVANQFINRKLKKKKRALEVRASGVSIAISAHFLFWQFVSRAPKKGIGCSLSTTVRGTPHGGFNRFCWSCRVRQWLIIFLHPPSQPDSLSLMISGDERLALSAIKSNQIMIGPATPS